VRVIVRRASVPHNAGSDGNGMKKLFIVLLALVASMAVVAIELSAARARHVAASAKLQQPDAKVEAGDDVVIEFANNPSPMPPFLVNDLDGNVISTAAWHGKVVLLNFWATWCPPCREEIPMMIELASRYKDRLQIIGVSMDDAPPEEVREFAKHEGITYPVIMGSRSISAEYGGVPALPTSFVVNTDGRIVQKHTGLYSLEVYDNEVRALLGMPVSVKVETFDDRGQIFLKNAVNATDLPGVDFSGLRADQKRAALKKMNSLNCTCGCKLTIAQCRINDTSCSTSLGLAQTIVREIKSENSASPASKAIRQ
jgi:thiol-disulfide isomerase/thioredoxin